MTEARDLVTWTLTRPCCYPRPRAPARPCAAGGRGQLRHDPPVRCHAALGEGDAQVVCDDGEGQGLGREHGHHHQGQGDALPHVEHGHVRRQDHHYQIQADEVVHSADRVLADRSVLFKYMNPTRHGQGLLLRHAQEGDGPLPHGPQQELGGVHLLQREDQED